MPGREIEWRIVEQSTPSFTEQVVPELVPEHVNERRLTVWAGLKGTNKRQFKKFKCPPHTL